MPQMKRGFVIKKRKNPKYNEGNRQRYSNVHSSKCLFKDKTWLQTLSAQLEDHFRKVVKEEIEQAIQRSPLFMSRLLPSQGEPSGSKEYRLQFGCKLPNTLFTGNKVVAEGNNAPIKIQLLDTVSKHLIKDGPLSSKRVEIVVLDGHFKAEQLEEWTKEEFCGHILSARVNKRPLLVGERVIALRNGIGFVDDICITDNSSWQRSKMFRLGAKLLGEQDQVMEAVSSPFKVKDRRGETYQKHIIPSPEDEVWRLCWIAKRGKIHDRLKEHNIHKVKDLVTLYHNDQSLLRSILKVTSKKWDDIIKHATSSFYGNACKNSNDLAISNIPIDQQELQALASHTDAGEHIHQLDQSMALDNSLLDELLVGSSFNSSFL